MPRLGPALVATAVAALLAAPSASATQVQPVSSDASVTPPALAPPDRVIVEWAAGASPTERRAAREEAGVEYARELGTHRFQLVETEPGQTPGEAVRELEADPAVVLAERDRYLGLDSVPNDPLFDQLWGLQNTGLGIDEFSGALAGADISAPSAWERTVGTPSTVVADIDTGYRFEAPDLANVAWTNPGEIPGNGIDDDHDGIVDDVHGADFVGANAETPTVDGNPTDDNLSGGGHGVHTAGTIGAQGNNGIGITGVAQNVRIMPLRVCSGGCPASAIVEAINYAGAHGARAANVSLGGEVPVPSIREALAANPQTLFVFAGGNEHEDNDVNPHYPCVYDPLAEGKSAVDNVICVAATDQADQLAEFSNWGAKTVDLGAPGTQILSTFPVSFPLDEDFEANDFATKWTASGADGGFARTNEPPLTSFGISDSPGATPVAGSTRASTSVPIDLPPGFENCAVEQTRWISGGSFNFDVIFDGEVVFGVGTSKSGHISNALGDEFSEGGELSLSFSYKAGPNPSPGDGAWIDDVKLRCIARVGEPGGYAFLEGTSMAAPQVTGTAALLFSEKPSASVTEVRQALLGSVDPDPSLAGKTTSGGRLDAAAAVDLFDGVKPPIPALKSTSPPSPAANTQPRLIGSAQRGTGIAVYADEDCSGEPVAGGTSAQLAGPGIAAPAAADATTKFTVKATDLVPLESDCSEPIDYTDDSDLVAPAPPQLTSTDPPSPGTSATPRILGAAEVGSTVKVYAGTACAGSPVATGSAGELSSPGVPVHVAEGVTAAFSATATDSSNNASSCSAPISYTHVKATTGPGGGGGEGGPTPTPECTVPKLAGKTLAQARAALRAASCKLGKVRKPRGRKGKRLPPLVVKSSTPGAGANAVDGEVNLVLRMKPRKTRR